MNRLRARVLVIAAIRFGVMLPILYTVNLFLSICAGLCMCSSWAGGVDLFEAVANDWREIVDAWKDAA